MSVPAPAAAPDHEPQAAIFDMDGVLIDSYRAHFESCLRVAAELGRVYTEEQFAAGFGRTTREVIAEQWQGLCTKTGTDPGPVVVPILDSATGRGSVPVFVQSQWQGERLSDDEIARIDERKRDSSAKSSPRTFRRWREPLN